MGHVAKRIKMKTYFISVLILAGVFLCCKLGVFNLFSGFGLKVAAFVIVGILFVIGFFVLGNPFSGGSKNEDK